MAGIVSRGSKKHLSSLRANPLCSIHSPHLRFISPPQLYQSLSTGRYAPRIADTSIWKSIIPRPLREGSWKSTGKASQSSHRSSNLFYIAMFLLIGSEAIHILQLRTRHECYLRSTDSKIRQLREVIEKLGNGEEVDVRKALGTGNPTSEEEWEEVLKEIEMEEVNWQSKMRSRKNSQNSNDDSSSSDKPVENGNRQFRGPRFY